MNDAEQQEGVVLVVDDEKDLRTNIRLRLVGEKFKVIEAGDGQDALDKIENNHIDVVLMDSMMPKMDGLEALKKLREDYSPAALPVIMVTAMGENENIIQALQSGANDYVSKPCDMAVLTARINTQMSRRRAEDMKDKLIGVVAHELKAPLTSIYGSLSFFKDVHCDGLSDEAKELIELAFNGSKRLDRLLHNILDWEKLRSGNMYLNLETLNLADVVQESMNDTVGYAQQYEVVVRADVPRVEIEADRDALIRILTNLISNAVKFTNKGTEVLITAAVSSKSKLKLPHPTVAPLDAQIPASGEVILAVTDCGRGIPFEYQETIFDLFRQVKETDATEKCGTGLGLAITKSLVQQHGGNLWFGSEPGKGTTFFFPLKLASNGV